MRKSPHLAQAGGVSPGAVVAGRAALIIPVAARPLCNYELNPSFAQVKRRGPRFGPSVYGSWRNLVRVQGWEQGTDISWGATARKPARAVATRWTECGDLPQLSKKSQAKTVRQTRPLQVFCDACSWRHKKSCLVGGRAP